MALVFRRTVTLIANNRRLLLFLIALILFFVIISHLHQKLSILDSQLLRSAIKERKKIPLLATLESIRNKFPQVASYCNAPHQIKTNGELLPIDVLREHGLQLSSVVIAIRHGDRGPLRPLRHLDKIDCSVRNCLSEATLNSIYSEKIVEERHQNLLHRYMKAESFDFHKIVKFPRQYRIVPEDRCNPEHLTVIGALQHLILGSKLAEVYKRELNIDATSTKKLLKAYSTKYPRTFQSAFAFLFGFINPTSTLEHEHFPTIESTYGHLFCGSHKLNIFCSKCDKLDQISKVFDEIRAKITTNDQATADAMFKIRALIAPSNTSVTFHSFESLFDGIMTHICHASPIPCDDLNGCATEDDVINLIESFKNYHLSLLKTKNYRKMNLIKTFGFYQQLIEHFHNVSKNEDHFKLLLFSGHDVTLIPIASVLNIHDGVIPPFASRLIFETYKSESAASYLRIVYNGNDVTKSTEICSSSTHCVQLQDSTTDKSFTLIRHDAFHHFIQFKLKELTNSNTYEKACVGTT